MIYGLEDIRRGFERTADAVVVGSGAAGAVAAANLGEAGLRTVLLEAGPEIKPKEMTRDAPLFLARYFWEGGLRILGGSAQVPSMQARCLGGSTLVNSAIMYKLPDWVRKIWAAEDGLDNILDAELDRAFDRVFEKTSTAPTPLAVMGRRNFALRDALDTVGVESGPLPRAAIDCDGCGDCLIGCPKGRKQSVERSYLPQAARDGVEIFTCAQVERVLTKGARAVGVEGRVVDPKGRRKTANFAVRAPLVILAAGVMATPVILQMSGIKGRGRVGGSLYTHLGGGVVSVMDEPIEPWVGATQGWGAISEDIPGMKFESLWAPPSVLTVRWGGVGRTFLSRIADLRNVAISVCVYRGRVDGRVRPGLNGLPSTRLWIPREEMRPVQRGLKLLADAFQKSGARYSYVGLPGTKEEMRTEEDTTAMLNPKLKPRDFPFTANHVFGSCRMSADPRRGAVDPNGKVHDVDNLYVCDTSIFPSGIAVNPQATVMALADVITRRVAELRA